MLRSRVSRAALAAAASLANAWVVHTAYSQVGTSAVAAKRDTLRQNARRVEIEYRPFLSHQGFATSHALPVSKKAWAAVLNVPGAASSARAGFYLQSLHVDEGVPIPEARATATFAVLDVKGMVGVSLEIYDDSAGRTKVAASRPAITEPGRITLTTPAVTLEAGKYYHLRAFAIALSGVPGGAEVSSACTTVDELKWLF